MQEQHDLAIDDFDQQDFELSQNTHTNPDDDYFDSVVGALQEIVISEEFEKMHSDFIARYCQKFEPSEQNKLEYTPIFKAYQSEIESYVEKGLRERIKDCDMMRFNKLLEARHEQIDDQLLDMLLSFDDFDQFKKLMLDYRQSFQAAEKAQKKEPSKVTQPAIKPPAPEGKGTPVDLQPELFLSIKPLRKKK